MSFGETVEALCRHTAYGDAFKCRTGRGGGSGGPSGPAGLPPLSLGFRVCAKHSESTLAGWACDRCEFIGLGVRMEARRLGPCVGRVSFFLPPAPLGRLPPLTSSAF